MALWSACLGGGAARADGGDSDAVRDSTFVASSRVGKDGGDADEAQQRVAPSAAGRLASDFRSLSEEQPETNVPAPIPAELSEEASAGGEGRAHKLDVPRRDGPGIGLPKRKWYKDWHGAVFMGVGTHDTWHAGFSVHGYVIPDRLSLGISTCAGRFPWGYYGRCDRPE